MNDAPPRRPLSIYLVAAEESGDALGGALGACAHARRGQERDARRRRRPRHGGGGHRQPVLDRRTLDHRHRRPSRAGCRLILRRIRETADAVVAARPDALVIIDSPDFTHRVARRVRAARAGNPDRRLRVADGVGMAARGARAPCAPMSIACWRSCRSSRRRSRGSTARPASMSAIRWSSGLAELRPNAEEARRRRSDPPLVLVLPGSRSSEIGSLLAIFGAAIGRLAARTGPMELVLPTLPHLAARVRQGVAGWPVVRASSSSRRKSGPRSAPRARRLPHPAR